MPLSGGEPTPAWDIQSHLQFMQSNCTTLIFLVESLADYPKKDIGHDILSISTPGSGVYPGNAAFSVGLARLLNAVTSHYFRHEILTANDGI